MNSVVFQLVCGTLALLLATTTARAVDQTPLSQASEQLHYRISYRGVFTAYAWKDLADMTLYAFPSKEKFNGASVCRATMTVDTRNFSFADLAYPVRLRYDALAAPDLSTTHLVSDHDDGHENIHNVMWYEWGQQRIKLYRKRLQVPVDSAAWESRAAYRWEPDGKEPLPAFLTDFPPVDEGISYLIHRRTKRRVAEPAAMDPLTMLYALRAYDYQAQEAREFAVVHKSKVGHYSARLIGRERLPGQTQELLHVRVRQRDVKDGEAGQLDVWLADDQQRVIVRFDIEAPVGLIRVDLNGQPAGRMLGGCADAALQWAAR